MPYNYSGFEYLLVSAAWVILPLIIILLFILAVHVAIEAIKKVLWVRRNEGRLFVLYRVDSEKAKSIEELVLPTIGQPMTVLGPKEASRLPSWIVSAGVDCRGQPRLVRVRNGRLRIKSLHQELDDRIGDRLTSEGLREIVLDWEHNSDQN